MRIRSRLRRTVRALTDFLRGFTGLAGPPRRDSDPRCC
jgi:hypothetical protein